MSVTRFFIILLCLFLIILLYDWVSPTVTSKVSEKLPPLIHNFVGRQTDIDQLHMALEFSAKHRIVGITGAPGFGKSTLAIHIGHILKDDGVKVIYVDMNEVTGQHQLAEKIVPERNTDIYQWSMSLNKPTLLILDNCDKHLESDANDILIDYIMDKLVKYSDYRALMILTTSRYHFMSTKAILHQIKEISPPQSCELLQSMTYSLNSTVCLVIANLTGNVPLALQVIAAILNMQDSPKLEQIIEQLHKHLITTLSPKELRPSEQRVNVSIYLSYKYLDSVTQEIGRLLSYFPGSFDRYVIAEIVSNRGKTTHNTLHTLVRRSLLDYNNETERYVYHQLIREFFKDMSTPEEAQEFTTYFLDYYTESLELESKKHKYFSHMVPKFDGDKQNFKYFFDHLAEIKDIYRFKKVSDIIDNFKSAAVITTNTHIGQHLNKETNTNYFVPPRSGLTSIELQHYVIRSHLSNLKKLQARLIDIYECEWFAAHYSKLVIIFLQIESSLIHDIRTLIEHMKEHEWVFSSYEQHVSSSSYIHFFNQLADYYHGLQNYTMARKYRKKTMQHKNYSFPELAIIFCSLGDYETCMLYCDKELESIENSNLPPTINGAMHRIDRLIKLRETYLTIKGYRGEAATKLTKITAMFSDISRSHILVVEPQAIVDYARNVAYIIDLLQLTNETLCEEVMYHFKRGIEVYKGKQDELFQLVHKLYTKEKNYKKVILIGEALLKKKNENKEFIMTLYYVGQSLFLSGKFTESISYYEDVVMLPGVLNGMKYHACAQLMVMSSPKCITLLPDLMKHYIYTMFDTLYMFIISDIWVNISEPSNSELLHPRISDDFLALFKMSKPKFVIQPRPEPFDYIITAHLHRIFEYFPSFSSVCRLLEILFITLDFPYRFTCISCSLFCRFCNKVKTIHTNSLLGTGAQAGIVRTRGCYRSKPNPRARARAKVRAARKARAMARARTIAFYLNAIFMTSLTVLFLLSLVLFVLLYLTVIFHYIFTYSRVIYDNCYYIVFINCVFIGLHYFFFKSYEYILKFALVTLSILVPFFILDILCFFVSKILVILFLYFIIFILFDKGSYLIVWLSRNLYYYLYHFLSLCYQYINS